MKTTIIIMIIFWSFYHSSIYGGEIRRLKTEEDTVKIEPPEEKKPPLMEIEKVHKEIPIERKEKVRKEYPRINPSVLFTAPTGYVIPKLAVYSVGGSTIAPEIGEHRGRFSALIFALGLGNIAEIQFNWWRTFTNLVSGGSNIAATSLKIKVLNETKYTPAVAVLLKMAPVWQFYDEPQAVPAYHYSRSAILYCVGSKRFGNNVLHLGANYSDYMLKTRIHRGHGVFDTTKARASLYGPVVGYEKEYGEDTRLVIEYQIVPRVNFEKKALDPVHMIILGGRFFLFKILSLDAGIVYPTTGKREEGIILGMIPYTNLTISFSLQQVRDLLGEL